jgi:hypothetical protein
MKEMNLIWVVKNYKNFNQFGFFEALEKFSFWSFE